MSSPTQDSVVCLWAICKEIKFSDADRVARRLAKKKARNALQVAKEGVKPQIKDCDSLTEEYDCEVFQGRRRVRDRLEARRVWLRGMQRSRTFAADR
jgi:enoyl-CoA hydratase/carnithine racemase